MLCSLTLTEFQVDDAPDEERLHEPTTPVPLATINAPNPPSAVVSGAHAYRTRQLLKPWMFLL